MGEEPVRVVAYAGGRGEESPRAFIRESGTREERVEVEEVLRSWVGEERRGRRRRRCFRVRGSDGREHLLSYDEKLAVWFLSLGDPPACRSGP